MFVCLWVDTANYGELEMFRRNSTEIRGGMEVHGVFKGGHGVTRRYGVARRRYSTEKEFCGGMELRGVKLCVTPYLCETLWNFFFRTSA